MKNLIYTLFLCLLANCASYSQVSISSTASPPDASAMLDVKSSSKGALIPRMKMSERDMISLPQTSLIIFQIDGDAGYYYNAGTSASPSWVRLLTSLSSALSCDGRIEIGALPYSITAPGSYYVSKNLTGTSGINIKAHNVTIDLNGFAIQGVGSTTAGILVDGMFNNITVTNGIVDSWDDQGLDASQSMNANISNVITSNNGDNGIEVGRNALIKHCISSNNLFDGISLSSGIIEMSTALANGSNGISLSNGGTIQNCTSANNIHNGIIGINNVLILNNYSKLNGRSGLYLNNGCKASGNSLTNNTENGIHALGAHNQIENNKCYFNIGSGLLINGSGNNIISNESSQNAIGYHIVSLGSLIIKNIANQNGANYNVPAGNSFAPVVNAATLVTATNPFSNIEY